MQNNTLTSNLTTLGKMYHLPDNWLAERPHLFSNISLELSSTDAQIIHHTIRAIESVVALPAFQAQALATAGISAQKNPGNPGVLFGYDFHLTPEGPKLIEINTNASGAFLVALLEAAYVNVPDVLKTWETRFIQMFKAEWHRLHPQQLLNTIAIVDHDPPSQFFYPEFLLFQTLFQAHNIRTYIVDPMALVLHNDKLYVNNIPVDLVYNRLTDFDLSQPAYHVLRQAYLQYQVVLTPHPYAHALYAHKLNLTWLGDAALLQQYGLDEATVQLLQRVVPVAQRVDLDYAENLWTNRKQLFFKPLSGYGGKGVYRGANITRRVFNDILAGDYIAQTLVPPSEMQVEGERRKIDLRAYVYAGEVLGFVARLYQGQTTNLRTPGGGFARVVEMSSLSSFEKLQSTPYGFNKTNL